jgi:hypothetical protein
MDLAETAGTRTLLLGEGRDITTPLSEVSVLNLCREGPACKGVKRASTLALRRSSHRRTFVCIGVICGSNVCTSHTLKAAELREKNFGNP